MTARFATVRAGRTGNAMLTITPGARAKKGSQRLSVQVSIGGRTYTATVRLTVR